MKKLIQYSGIRARTTMYTIVPVIIIFLITCSVLIVSLLNTQQRLATSEFQNIAGRNAANFERTIHNALDYLTSVSSVLEFQINEGGIDREALQRTLYYLFDGHTVDGSSIYFEPDLYDGKDAEYAGTMYGTALSGRIAFYFYRFNGRTGYRQEAMQDEIEFSLPLYTDTKEQNAPTYTKPEIYTIAGVDTLMFAIAYPIRGIRGEFIGVITADILLGELYAELQAETIYQTGYTIIANDKGQVVYSPRFEDIGKTREQVGLSYSLPADGVGSEIFNATSILNNKKTLVAGQTVYLAQLDSRFYISAAAPISEINAQGIRLTVTVASVSIALLILIAMLLYYLIGKMTKPLIDFTQNTRAIAQGDYSVRITGDYRDEYALLKDSMNLMTGRIEDSFIILQNILNGIDAFVYASEPSTGRLLFVNDQMKDAMGVTEDVIGQHCFRVFHDNRETMCPACPGPRLLRNPGTAVMREGYNAKTQRYYHTTDVLIDWIDGKKAHLQHSVDITDLKRMTEEKIKAEETSQTKSVFLANMSHEIRTPMNSIIGFTELALDDEISQKTKGYLSNILENSVWLLHIINDILDLSKIESGKLELENIPFNLHELFTACQSMITPKADEKGLTLYFYAEPSIGKKPLGDPVRIRQVLTNLLSNAVKFTSAGIVKVQSIIKEMGGGTVTMYFEVKDSGIGMTPEQIERAFDPFTQAESGTTRKFGGTGLGLAITKYLVELMGGKLAVESIPGVGSKFSFTLTFDTIDASGDELYTANITLNEMEKPTFRGEVLLCEDNSMNQQVICEHLSRVGLKTVVADNGKIGVDLVKGRKRKGEKQFDLIFMDMHMPVMDGLEAAAKIQEMDVGVPIVAMTANIMSHDRELYKNSGMVDYVGKPFTSQELWRCLMRFITPVNWQAENKDLYSKADDELRMKLVDLFIEHNRDKTSAITAALDAGDIGLAHRLAHTLKSNAAQLGKTRLQQAADTIEENLQDGRNLVTGDQLDALRRELDAAIAEYEPLVRERVPSEASEPLDEAAERKLLGELEPLLKDSNPDCLLLIDGLRLLPGSQELVRRMENFDFKAALQSLAEFKERM